MGTKKILCVKSISGFIEGNEYEADDRTFTNREDNDDVQVLIIESSEIVDGEIMNNCYFIPIIEVYNYFSEINV
jgi:hypothetical protein